LTIFGKNVRNLRTFCPLFVISAKILSTFDPSSRVKNVQFANFLKFPLFRPFKKYANSELFAKLAKIFQPPFSPSKNFANSVFVML